MNPHPFVRFSQSSGERGEAAPAPFLPRSLRGRNAVHTWRASRSLGAAYEDDDLVFCTVAGAPFERLAEVAKLPVIRLHDLRHTSATLLLDQGVALKVVSERLGHSSVSITADLYQHVLEHMQDEAATAVGAALLGGSL